MNCNNTYNPNMGMANATNMPNMGYAGNVSYMPNQGMYDMCGTNMMPQVMPGCNQVVQKCFVEDMPYYVGYNMHVVNNVVRRHIQIPVYSQSQEVVYFDEWQTGCGCGR